MTSIEEHGYSAAGPHIAASSFRCVSCGYDLTGTAVGGECPECGMNVADSLRAGTEKLQTSGKAKTCMIMGILSLVIFGPVFGPIAIIYYFAAKKQLKTGAYSDASRTMAKAGLVMGIIATVFGTLWITIMIAG